MNRGYNSLIRGMVFYEITVTMNSHNVKLTSMLTTLSDKHLYKHNMQYE